MNPRPDAAQFEQVLHHLRQTRGFDFTAYKRTSLMRAVARRMQAVGVETFDEYLDYLQVHQDEFAALFDTILINVTSFFRDPEVWSFLRTEVLPPLIRDRNQAEPIRVWSAGCASGEEAYSLAIALSELLGDKPLREHVKLYATDADDGALTQARSATYTDRQVQDVPPELLARYFDRSGDRFAINRDLRHALIFGKHDLVQDAPISKVDLLLCRNTLMYFNGEAQTQILSRFYFSLNPRGVIVLGRAEMLFSHAAMFVPLDLRRRVFRPVPKPDHRDRLLLLAQTGRDVMATNGENHARLRDAAFECESTAQLVLDTGGLLVAANTAARNRFRLGAGDIGRLVQDLEVSYRPAELRPVIARVVDQHGEEVLKDVQWNTDGDVRFVEVRIAPLFDDGRRLLGTAVTFNDTTAFKNVETELQHSNQALETAYEELQSTNEELETTNEELQSTVEELETTNEELESTNEELETMNEELQSTNEELQTMNDELRNRSTDLNSANAFLESVFGSLRSGVVVVDREFRVKVWNNRASDLWGIQETEAIGANFLNLDIGLPVADLRPGIRDVLGGAREHHEATVPATNRRGKPIQCRVTASPLRQIDKSISGVILLMDERG